MQWPVNLVGEYGVISDRAPQELPPNIWSDARNMRFVNGHAESMRGNMSVYTPLPIEPLFALNFRNDTTNYWVYAGEQEAHCWDGGTHTDITRVDLSNDPDYYSATDVTGWQGGVLSGVAFLNNGIDPPQAWVSPSPSSPLVDLPNWPANTSCRAIRPFKQFLIALDITKSGTRYPHMIKWSHPADPGTVPPSWDETDPTVLAGESVAPGETMGFIVDGLALRDIFVVYKEDTVWGMQLLNNLEVFRVYKIFDDGGIMSTNCAVEFEDGRHAVFGQKDIYQHDGQQKKSIIEERAKRRIFNSINSAHYRKCHVVNNAPKKEVWFCYPTGEAERCTEAFVWNYSSNTSGFRALPDTRHATVGIVNLSSITDQWGLDPQMWAEDTTRWNERLYNPLDFRVITVSPEREKIYVEDFTNSQDGQPFEAMLERIGLAIPSRQNQPPDMSNRKFMRRVWPRIDGTAGKTVWIQVGTQEGHLREVNWRAPLPFVIGQSEYVDPRCAGRLFAIRFFTEDIMAWRLYGYELEYEVVGRH